MAPFALDAPPTLLECAAIRRAALTGQQETPTSAQRGSLQKAWLRRTMRDSTLMNTVEKIAKLQELQARLRGSKFRKAKTERGDVIGELAGLLIDEGMHDGLMQAGVIFATDGLSNGRYESTQHQVDMWVTSAITRLKQRLSAGRARDKAVGDKVFIGHGRSPAWRELKDFLAERLGLPWDEFNRVPVAGKQPNHVRS